MHLLAVVTFVFVFTSVTFLLNVIIVKEMLSPNLIWKLGDNDQSI